MPSTFNDFSDKTSFAPTDKLVGFDSTGLGGEKKWNYSTLRDSISSQMVLSLSADNIFTATGSLCARSLANRFADVINVKDFGAVGDGVDDTEAIQAAIDYANEQGGGTVFFPEPSSFYACKQTFTIGSNTALVGSENRPVLKWISTPNPTSAYPGQTPAGRRGLINKDYVGGNEKITVRNLVFDFSLIVSGTGARQVVYFYNCNFTILDNCRVLTDGAMICNVRTTNYTVSNNYFEQQGTSASSDGVIDQWDGSQNGTIQNNTLVCNSLSRWAILVTATDTQGNPSIRSCKNFFISNNKITNSKFAAISTMGRKDGCFNVIIDSNYINGNLSDTYSYGAIDIRANDNLTISNNIIENTTKSGILLGKEGAVGFYTYQNNNNVTIIGNILKNISSSSSFNAIQFESPSINKINVVGNIVVSGSYNYAIFKDSGTTITEYSLFSNQLTKGVSAPINTLSLNNIVINANDGNAGAILTSSVNDSTNSTRQTFYDNGVNFLNSSDSSVFLISHQPTNVNRIQINSSDTSVPPSIQAASTVDSNIDLKFLPKGTGTIMLPVTLFTTSAGTPTFNGYVTIKDSSGNTKKIPTIA